MKNSLDKTYLLKFAFLSYLLLILSQTSYAESAAKQSNIDEVALVLGGVSETSGMNKDIVESAQYRAYNKRMDITWKKFNDSLLSAASKWQKDNLSDIKTETLFYPFSGPDIVNAVTFFPDSKEYIMLGLEKPGEIPDLKNKSLKEISDGLNKLEISMNTLIGLNYFYTNMMAEEIGSHSFNGVAGVMMHFLVRTGHQILKVEYISLDSHGNEIVLSAQGRPVLSNEEDKSKSVEINRFFKAIKIGFKKRGDGNPEKTAYYFQLDASDPRLALVPEFTKFILKKQEMTTMLKASSYLMFSRYFDDMRSIILSRSKFVMQGASGIPYSYFKADPTWDLKLYGRFTRPTPLFSVRCQPDLVKDSKELPAGELNFHYDYFYRGEKSFILVAKRKAGWKPGEPVFDKSSDQGKETICQVPSK